MQRPTTGEKKNPCTSICWKPSSWKAALHKRPLGSWWAGVCHKWTSATATYVPLWQGSLLLSWAALDKTLPVGGGKWLLPSTQYWWGHNLLFWAPQYKRDIKGLEQLPCDKRWDFGLGISSKFMNTSKECLKRTVPGSFRCHSLTGQKVMGSNWHTGGSVWTWRNTFWLFGWPSPSTGCLERLWIFPWRHSKAVWTQFWATCC